MTDPHAVAGDELALWTWSAPHPDDGGEVAHLLVTPRAAGIEAAMAGLADVLGVRPTTATHGVPGAVPAAMAWGAVAPTDSSPLFVLVHAGGVVGRPVDSGWRAAALARRYVVLTLGTVPVPDHGSTTDTGAHVDVPRYVRSAPDVFHGLLALS